MSRARHDEKIRGRRSDGGCTTPSGQVARAVPDLWHDGKLGEETFELPQGLLLAVAARAVPEFQPNQGAPARGAGLEDGLDSRANGCIAIGTQEVDPGRSVDQDHG